MSPPENTISRRRFVALAGASAAAFSLPGCSRSEKKGPVRLVFSHGEETAVLREQISRFNRLNAGKIRVAFRLAPADTSQYFEMLRTGFLAGKAGADVISGDVIWPAGFAAEGWVSDLSARFDETLRREHLPATVKTNTHEGAVYGVPWFTDAGLLYFRQDLLEDSGFSEPPRTWEEMEEQAGKVQRDAGARYGFVFQGAEYEGGVVNGLEFLWGAGGDVLSEGLDEVVVGEPESVAGLVAARELVEGGVSPEAVSSFKELESRILFLGGDAVFMRNWPNVYGQAGDPELSRVEPERIGVAPLPTTRAGLASHGGLGGWNLMLNAASTVTQERADAAWEFVRYLSAPEQQKERAIRGGFLPTLKGCYKDPEVLDEVPVITLGLDAIENARPRPATPSYGEMSPMMARRFHSSFAGTSGPREAALALEKDLQGVLKKAAGA